MAPVGSSRHGGARLLGLVLVGAWQLCACGQTGPLFLPAATDSGAVAADGEESRPARQAGQDRIASGAPNAAASAAAPADDSEEDGSER